MNRLKLVLATLSKLPSRLSTSRYLMLTVSFVLGLIIVTFIGQPKKSIPPPLSKTNTATERVVDDSGQKGTTLKVSHESN